MPVPKNPKNHSHNAGMLMKNPVLLSACHVTRWVRTLHGTTCALYGESKNIKSGNFNAYVAPQTITDYVLNRQGFLACEAMNRKIGRMTKELKLSPYVTAGAQYYKAMQGDFNLIMQIINRHSSTQGEEKNAFLELLTNRGF